MLVKKRLNMSHLMRERERESQFHINNCFGCRGEIKKTHYHHQLKTGFFGNVNKYIVSALEMQHL